MITSLLSTALSEPSLPKSPPSNDTWMPLDASTFASDVDGLYNFLFWLSVFSALAIYGVMFYFIVKYRAKGREANEVGIDGSHHNTALEIAWSVAPLVVCVFIFVWGFEGFVNMRTAPKDAVEIHVTGQKWKWGFKYSNGVESDELHVPVDQDVRVIIQSVDVLHSLYIPAFRTKMDAVPGRYTDLWFHATKTGEFPVFCAEYCGTSHSDMLAKAVVHESGGYEKWLAAEEAKTNDMPPIELGEKLYDQKGCVTCHSVDGSSKIGPTWKGLYGASRSFADGSSAKADEEYIRTSINNPAGQVVQGYAPSMPSFQGQLSDKQITGLVEYIKSLK